jgi:hypothetical protein
MSKLASAIFGLQKNTAGALSFVDAPLIAIHAACDALPNSAVTWHIGADLNKPDG